jgi:hypothetical protein
VKFDFPEKGLSRKALFLVEKDSGALWTLGSGDSRSYDSNGEKPSQPGFARGNAPLLPPAAASPPEGEILAVL